MKVLSILLVGVICTPQIFGVKDKSNYNAFGITKESRAEDLERILSYQLIDIKYSKQDDDDGLNFLTFESFGETFSLLLSTNERLIASNVRFGGDGIPPNSLGHITSLSESCHYLVEDILISDISMDNSGGGISMCNKRGLRAHFWHDGEEYTIKPASFYLGNPDEHIDNIH